MSMIKRHLLVRCPRNQRSLQIHPFTILPITPKKKVNCVSLAFSKMVFHCFQLVTFVTGSEQPFGPCSYILACFFSSELEINSSLLAKQLQELSHSNVPPESWLLCDLGRLDLWYTHHLECDNMTAPSLAVQGNNTHTHRISDQSSALNHMYLVEVKIFRPCRCILAYWFPCLIFLTLTGSQAWMDCVVEETTFLDQKILVYGLVQWEWKRAPIAPLARMNANHF